MLVKLRPQILLRGDEDPDELPLGPLTRQLTKLGVCVKTLLLLLCLAAAVYCVTQKCGSAVLLFVLALGGFLFSYVCFVLLVGLKEATPWLALLYAAMHGCFLGGVFALLEYLWPSAAAIAWIGVSTPLIVFFAANLYFSSARMFWALGVGIILVLGFAARNGKLGVVPLDRYQALLAGLIAAVTAVWNFLVLRAVKDAAERGAATKAAEWYAAAFQVPLSGLFYRLARVDGHAPVVRSPDFPKASHRRRHK